MNHLFTGDCPDPESRVVACVNRKESTKVMRIGFVTETIQIEPSPRVNIWFVDIGYPVPV